MNLAATTNRLLSTLAGPERNALDRFLVRVNLPRGAVLEQPDAPIEFVYFMQSGFASVHGGGDRVVETALIGFEGMTGARLLMGDDRSMNLTLMRTVGSAMRLAVPALRQGLAASPSLETFLRRYALAFGAQVSQTAVVNGRATVEKRLARWLLMAHDRFCSDTLAVTHDSIATLLCVRRASVTIALQVFEGDHLIKANRRSIMMLDRKGLERRSDPTYGVAEREYERLVGDAREVGWPRLKRSACEAGKG
jgi:CRP-like cAMP-binding protein